MTKRKTTEEFINEAKEVHGDFYIYTEVDYKNSNTPICIICPIHGEFWQLPSEHLKGYGCKKCSDSKRRFTNEDIISKIQKVHGDKYITDKIQYINYHSKICLICPKHGEFWISPAKLLKGQGCPKCNKKGGKKVKVTIEDFKERCTKLYNGKYIYDEVYFDKLNDEVTIICPIHGRFKQKAKYHLQGNGCRKCADEERLKSFNDFIDEANKIHNNKYIYTKFKYVNSYTKGIIICPIHGEFLMSPKEHIGIYGKGCPKCGHKLPLSDEEWKTKANKKFNNFFQYKSPYINDSTEIVVSCPIHGDFTIMPNNHLQSLSGCPICSHEKNVSETKLYNSLSAKFPFCLFNKNCFNIIKRQELDIFSEKYKIAVEYQGQQHFVPIDYFGGEKTLERTKERDIQKIKKCSDNKIKLFHFTYDKNVDISNVPYKVYIDEEELFNDIQEYINEKERLNQ